MQRRAAALYSLFFLLIAAIAGAYSTVAEPAAVAGAQAIVVLSVITAILLLSLSYLPSRG